MNWGALVFGSSAFLEVKLQSKLDLARVEEREARGPNLAEVSVVKVRRVGDCDDTVTAESGSVECRVIGDVEEFRPEFEVRSLIQTEVFERREIQSAEGGSGRLTDAPPQQPGAS